MSRGNTKRGTEIGFVFRGSSRALSRPATPAEGDALASVRALRISVTLWPCG